MIENNNNKNNNVCHRQFVETYTADAHAYF